MHDHNAWAVFYFTTEDDAIKYVDSLNKTIESGLITSRQIKYELANLDPYICTLDLNNLRFVRYCYEEVLEKRLIW